jgi:hypothetical protein
MSTFLESLLAQGPGSVEFLRFGGSDAQII